MKNRVAALIPAAGKGERLGKGPKALLPLGQGSILEWSIAAFAGLVDEVIVAVSRDMLGATTRLDTNIRVIEGGATRQESVFELLKATEAELVLIHDAARPFLSRSVIQSSIDAALQHGAATVVKAVPDSLIEADSGKVVDRSSLRAVQTPQSFRRELILAAHENASRTGFKATDDAALLRRLGHSVALVEGNAWLFKITTPDDYEMAQLMAGVWHARA